MDYIVSGHGGRFQDTPTIEVPANFQVSFFVIDGYTLADEVAWPLLNHLLPGLILPGNASFVRARIVSTVSAGNPVYNYSCWHYPNINHCSGVFAVGAVTTNHPVIDLANYPGHPALSLADIFRLRRGNPGHIFWLACRNIS